MKTIAEKLQARTQPGPDGCLIWTGAIDSDGYPKLTHGRTPRGHARIIPAHRANWELVNGPIPEVHMLARRDICLNRRCIAVEHLKLMTRAEVQSAAGRASHGYVIFNKDPYNCGHERTPENTWLSGDGYGYCKPCAQARLYVYNRTRRDYASQNERRRERARATRTTQPIAA